MRAIHLLLALCLSVSCASVPTAGTGDVAFRLLWNGESDLDLHVLDPYGQHLFFGRPTALGGGWLDVDCNAGTGQLCARPIENVFWPHGTAPTGAYRVWVQAHAIIPAEAPVRARLLILEGETVVEERQADLGTNGDRLGPFVLDFSREAGPGPLEDLDPRRSLSPVPYRCEDGFAFSLAAAVDFVEVTAGAAGPALRLESGAFGPTAYESEDESALLAWAPGEPPMFVLDGIRHPDCRPLALTADPAPPVSN